jgi:non-homologous end joining protein Ku
MKGYEAEKGKYIELTCEVLEAIAMDSTRMIDIDDCTRERDR